MDECGKTYLDCSEISIKGVRYLFWAFLMSFTIYAGSMQYVWWRTKGAWVCKLFRARIALRYHGDVSGILFEGSFLGDDTLRTARIDFGSIGGNFTYLEEKYIT